MGMKQSKKGKPPPIPISHWALLNGASTLLGAWVMAFGFPEARGPLALLGLVVWQIVWLGTFMLLYGPTEPPEGRTEAKEKGQ